ncbi:MAG: hypothetical protein QOD42_1483 [Sphingomonadales bacterium]|jgi:hypothetical protein|nr:hypothetical protein [Sphingomonadales bacterium]
MNILTGNQGGAARLSVKGADLGLPLEPHKIIADIARSAASPATPLRAAPATGDHGLRAPVRASGSETAEIKVFEPLVKDAVSAIPGGKGLVKVIELGQSSLKLATTFDDLDSSLLAKTKVTIDFGGDLVSFAKAAFPQFGANPLVQAVDFGLKASALCVDLVGAAKEERKLPFWIGSAS